MRPLSPIASSRSVRHLGKHWPVFASVRRYSVPPLVTSKAKHWPALVSVRRYSVPPLVTSKATTHYNKFARHPWLNQVQHLKSLDDCGRILTFIAGHCAAGNLASLIRDWSFLEPHQHVAGIEVILQNLLYFGVPHVLNSLTALANFGVESKLVIDDKPTTVESQAKAFERGQEILRQSYRHKNVIFRERIKNYHPCLDNWICLVMGRIFTREVDLLNPKIRQLCAIIAASNFPPFPMFVSSVNSAINLGATVEEVSAVLDTVELIWGRKAQAVIDAMWSDMNKKKLYIKEQNYNSNPIYKEEGEVIATNQALLWKREYKELPKEMTERHRANYLQNFRPVPELPDWLRLTCLLAGHTAAGYLSKVNKIWSLLPVEYHKHGVEALLQTIVFAGWPKVISAWESINAGVGIHPSALEESPIELQIMNDPVKMRERGKELFRKIYGKNTDQLRARLQETNADFENIVIENVYGQILGRESPGIEVWHRELWAISCMSGKIVFPQLRSHIFGAIANGASAEQVRGILDQTAEIWDWEQQNLVDGIWLDIVRHKTTIK